MKKWVDLQKKGRMSGIKGRQNKEASDSCGRGVSRKEIFGKGGLDVSSSG